MWDEIAQGWFTFQNSSAVTTITSGYFTLANASSFGNVTTGWFRFSNFPVWQNVRSGWFRFSNVSAWVLLTSGYFTFENVSNATPIVTILLPHTGETKRFDVPFLITYSIYSSKKENVNVSLQVVYQGISGWVNLTNVSMNSNQYWYNSTFDIATIMAALGVHYDYNVPYFLNLSATNVLTNLHDDDQSQFRLRDSTFDLIILIFPLVILLLFSILAFWKQSKIILTAAITTAILYATILATQFAGTIDSWFVVMLVVYSLALSMMYFFWKKKGTKPI
jgi:general stress protein CsbA